MASLHRELAKTISVQENGQHRVITKLDAIFAQLVAQSVNGKPSQQKMLLSLLTQCKHETTVQETLEQLQSYDEDRLNELYEQLGSMDDYPPDGDDNQGGDVDD
jgi:formate dehydrogenase maturation protein FdhE